MSDPVVDYSNVRGWSFPRGLSRSYEPMLYHCKRISTADKALAVHFFLYFSYTMRYCFLLAPLYWDLWGGRFRAADVHLITGVIPSNFKYDNLFQSKLTSVHGVSRHYIYTKFYQGMSAMSDPVVDYSHVRGWSFPRGLSWCYEPILYHHKHKSTTDKALKAHFFSLFFLCHEILFPQ